MKKCKPTWYSWACWWSGCWRTSCCRRLHRRLNTHVWIGIRAVDSDPRRVGRTLGGALCSDIRLPLVKSQLVKSTFRCQFNHMKKLTTWCPSCVVERTAICPSPLVHYDTVKTSVERSIDSLLRGVDYKCSYCLELNWSRCLFFISWEIRNV